MVCTRAGILAVSYSTVFEAGWLQDEELRDGCPVLKVLVEATTQS